MPRLLVLTLSIAVSSTTASADPAGVGVESDLYAWTTGGYHASAWFGTNQVRVRAVKGLFYAPSFTVPDGFERLRNDAWEFFVDVAWRARGPRFEGVWTGVGVELYYRRIRNDTTNAEEDYEALEPALRTGYIWRPFKSAGFYVNPWIGVNVRVDGESTVVVDGRTYSAPRISPLASVKLGWQF